MQQEGKEDGEGGEVQEGVTSSNGDHLALADFNHVVTREGLCVLGAGVAHQWTNTTPCCQHITTTNYRGTQTQ